MAGLGLGPGAVVGLTERDNEEIDSHRHLYVGFHVPKEKRTEGEMPSNMRNKQTLKVANITTTTMAVGRASTASNLLFRTFDQVRQPFVLDQFHQVAVIVAKDYVDTNSPVKWVKPNRWQRKTAQVSYVLPIAMPDLGNDCQCPRIRHRWLHSTSALNYLPREFPTFLTSQGCASA